MLLTKYRTYLDFDSFPTNVLFPIPGSNWESYIAFGCPISLVSFNLWQFLNQCFSWPWLFWRVLVMYFVKCRSFWMYLMFPDDLVEAMHYWKEPREMMLCPLQCIISGGEWCQYILLVMLTLSPWLGCGLQRLCTAIYNWKLISIHSKYLFMCQTTLCSRAVMLIPVCKSRWPVKPLAQ